MLEGVSAWLFEWVGADPARVWVFIAVCVVAIVLGALASLLDLGLEFSVATVLGLIVSAHSGFFLGFAVFSLVFLLLYIYIGRSARVDPADFEGPAGQ